MVIPFPIAFFVGTFLADVAYWYSANLAWAAATLWLLGAGLVMAALAAVLGLTDVFGDSQIRALPPVWWHASGNVLVVLIELFNFYFRYDQGAAFIVRRFAPAHFHRLERRGNDIPRTCRRFGRLTGGR
jgi:uncharacterized membrane protein